MNVDRDIIVEERHGGVPNVAVKCPNCRKWAPMYPVGKGVYSLGLHYDRYGICDGVGKRALLGKVPALLRGNQP